MPRGDAAPGRGLWLGRLFGVPGSLAETDGGPVKSRRPSSWLPPTVSVLALVKRGAPPEPLSPPEELEASAASVVQTHRWGEGGGRDALVPAPVPCSFLRNLRAVFLSSCARPCSQQRRPGAAPRGLTSACWSVWFWFWPCRQL
uniref:Uncharacterized protein n=1 Tax=Neovison vison TaxID=452646 RepID=A0A8C7BN13_NEOVI